MDFREILASGSGRSGEPQDESDIEHVTVCIVQCAQSRRSRRRQVAGKRLQRPACIDPADPNHSDTSRGRAAGQGVDRVVHRAAAPSVVVG